MLRSNFGKGIIALIVFAIMVAVIPAENTNSEAAFEEPAVVCEKNIK